jgi:MFS transporter, PPP family, 3-phenylpropionic acid transporter
VATDDDADGGVANGPGRDADSEPGGSALRHPETAFGATARFGLVEIFFWGSVACFEAFLVPWLRGHGYSPSQAGLIFAVVAGFAVVGQPLLGSVGDRVASPGRMVAVALLIGMVAFVSMPLAVGTMAFLVLLAVVYSLTIASLPAVLDAWILRRREQIPGIQYGIARGAGSFGFAAGGIILGLLADRVGVGVIFPAFAILALGAVWFALAISRRARREANDAAAGDASDDASRDGQASPPGTASTSGAVPGHDEPLHERVHPLPVSPLARSVLSAREQLGGAFRAVLSNRPYIVFLVGSFFAFSGLRAALTFLPYLFESVGGTVGQVGLAHSFGALSEIPFFVGAALLHRRIRGPRLISVVLILMGIRLLAYTWMPTPRAIIYLQLSHGLTFGVFMATAVDYIHRIAPPEHRGFFQALAPSVFFGLGSIVGSWLGGMLLEATSLTWLYRIAAVIALIGAPIPLFSGTNRVQSPHETNLGSR